MPTDSEILQKARAWLKRKEWSMGNGQCPECFGVPPSWLGHPCYLTPDTIGHKFNCALAAVLKDPIMLGYFTLDG